MTSAPRRVKQFASTQADGRRAAVRQDPGASVERSVVSRAVLLVLRNMGPRFGLAARLRLRHGRYGVVRVGLHLISQRASGHVVNSRGAARASSSDTDAEARRESIGRRRTAGPRPGRSSCTPRRRGLRSAERESASTLRRRSSAQSAPLSYGSVACRWCARSRAGRGRSRRPGVHPWRPSSVAWISWMAGPGGMPSSSRKTVRARSYT
jgi:hypothetical protein